MNHSKFIPLAKSFLSSKDKAKRLTKADNRIDKRTIGYKRLQDAQKKATETISSSETVKVENGPL